LARIINCRCSETGVKGEFEGVGDLKGEPEGDVVRKGVFETGEGLKGVLEGDTDARDGLG
jgi:hypothetical protein